MLCPYRTSHRNSRAIAKHSVLSTRRRMPENYFDCSKELSRTVSFIYPHECAQRIGTRNSLKFAADLTRSPVNHADSFPLNSSRLVWMLIFLSPIALLARLTQSFKQRVGAIGKADMQFPAR